MVMSSLDDEKRIVAIDNTSRYVVEDADPSLKKKKQKEMRGNT